MAAPNLGDAGLTALGSISDKGSTGAQGMVWRDADGKTWIDQRGIGTLTPLDYTPEQLQQSLSGAHEAAMQSDAAANSGISGFMSKYTPALIGLMAGGAGLAGDFAGLMGGAEAGAASDAGLATAADASAQGSTLGGFSGGGATPGATAITDPLSAGLTAPGTAPEVGGGMISSAATGGGGGVGSGIFDKFMQGFSKNPIMSSLQVLQGGLGVASGLASIMGKGSLSPTAAQNRADPFASSRQQYIDKLNAVMANPALAASQPGYQFQLQQGQQQLDRQMAARGQTGTGAGAAATVQYGQDYAMNSYNNYVNQLIGLSGAGQNPAAGAAAFQNSQNQGFKALGQGIGAVNAGFNGVNTSAASPTGGGPSGYNATQYTAPIENPAANFNNTMGTNTDMFAG